MQITDAINLYKQDMMVEGAADATQIQYLRHVTNFITKSGINEVSEITPPKISSYKAGLLNNNVGASAINVYFSALRHFFKFLKEQGYIAEDYSTLKVCKGYDSKKVGEIRGKNQSEDPDDKPGRCITKKEQKDLVEYALKNTRTLKHLNSTEGQRNAMMIRINLVCGMRISDLVKLKVKDFGYHEDMEDWRLEYKAQKQKRKVEFFVCANSVMNDLFDYIQYNNLAPEDYLFPTNRGTKMKPNAFYLIFTKIAKAAGIEGIAPHDMRRTVATTLYESGVSLYEISQVLGHASTEMTQRYLRIKATQENLSARRKALAKAV